MFNVELNVTLTIVWNPKMRMCYSEIREPTFQNKKTADFYSFKTSRWFTTEFF